MGINYDQCQKRKQLPISTMYVTRPLSQYKRFPYSLYAPPEGPNSGYLVIQDEESETYSCFGLCKNTQLMDLPLPQNKELTIRYSSGAGENESVSHYDVAFIPVLNQPLSSNLYYAIKPHGSHKGEAYICSREEDMTTLCFCSFKHDLKPRPLDPNNIYQQFGICLSETTCSGGGDFYAVSVAPDGFPPHFLRRKGWDINTKTPKHYRLSEAPGLDTSLRAHLPEFNSSESVVIGKWYCPFMFIRERTQKEQVKKSMFYEMTLEQRWEQIFTTENYYKEGNIVSVDVNVQSENVFVAGRIAVWNEEQVVNGAVWFKGFSEVGEEISVGLSSLIVERMKWEQERGGWVRGQDRQVNVKRAEEFVGTGEGRKFGCFALVERYVLKRMDGSLVLTYDFLHTHQIRSKWE